jgi:hypothetical protein
VIYLSLRKWSGRFSPAAIAKIRRSIQIWVDQDVCVLAIDDGAAGLTDTELERDWPSGKVRFSKTHPELAGPWRKESRKKRRSEL